MKASLSRLLRRIIPSSSGPSANSVLPAGNYYTVLWRIPETFGGLTSVALERSSAFARQDNRPIEILTFSPNNSGKEREQELKAEGRLDDRVSIRNIWEDLGTWSDDELARMKGMAEPDLGALKDALPHTSGNTREQRTDDAGTVLQTDYYSTEGLSHSGAPAAHSTKRGSTQYSATSQVTSLSIRVMQVQSSAPTGRRTLCSATCCTATSSRTKA